ncbi:hypothetical protein SO802_019716 [Lithocarpus litseifolius]|uniref:Uncharacterized protein n=1 Tax=Lithocarpus litseifolius TaxID=425828 RepID=A0AAW2CRJ6_9ROSI
MKRLRRADWRREETYERKKKKCSRVYTYFCLNLQKVLHLLLHGNKLTGSLPKAILDSSYLLTLDIRDNNIFGNIPDEIDGLPNLKSLLLRGNNFSGLIPKKLCRLKMLSIIDLSKNSFSGTIPYCFMNIAFGKLVESVFQYGGGTYIAFLTGLIPYKSLLNVGFEIEGSYINFNTLVNTLVKIEILTKYKFDLYMGPILDMISVLDLSSNRLTGEIPPELGQLSSIHALNLSYNQLIGSIPRTFSNMTQIESLDLSHNSFSGK